MPILLCPTCGEHDLVSLAMCECYIGGLPHLTLSGCGAFVVLTRCGACSSSANETHQGLVAQYRPGDKVMLKCSIPKLLSDPKCAVQIPAGSFVTIIDAVDCKSDGIVYIVRTSLGIETCIIPDWIQ